jgi:protein TonB
LQRIPPERITQGVALLSTVVILWLLFAVHSAEVPQPARDPGVQLSVLEQPPAPAPKVEPEKPKPRIVPVRRPHAPAATPDVTPAPSVAPPADSPDEPIVAAVEPFEPAPPPSHTSIEAAYQLALRQNIDARKELPDTAQNRLLRPHGEAVVRFTLDRGGNVSGVALVRTSGSRIVDEHALHVVSSGHYPPFPEGAYPSELHHFFMVTIEITSK